MKKYSAIICMILCLLCFCGCGGKKENNTPSAAEVTESAESSVINPNG